MTRKAFYAIVNIWPAVRPSEYAAGSAFVHKEARMGSKRYREPTDGESLLIVLGGCAIVSAIMYAALRVDALIDLAVRLF